MQWRQGHTGAVVAVLLLFWLLRNLPWQPFVRLAPDPPVARAEVSLKGEN